MLATAKKMAIVQWQSKSYNKRYGLMKFVLPDFLSKILMLNSKKEFHLFFPINLMAAYYVLVKDLARGASVQVKILNREVDSNRGHYK